MLCEGFIRWETQPAYQSEQQNYDSQTSKPEIQRSNKQAFFYYSLGFCKIFLSEQQSMRSFLGNSYNFMLPVFTAPTYSSNLRWNAQQSII